MKVKILNAVTMRNSRGIGVPVTCQHVTFSLLPSPVPRQMFVKAHTLQKQFNLLIHKVAHDHEFLKKTLQSTVNIDSFTRQLWEIYNVCREDVDTQKMYLGILRCDYMITKSHRSQNGNTVMSEHGDVDNNWKLKLVEINSVSARHVGLTCQMTELHRQVLNLLEKKSESEKLPPNKALAGCAAGLVKAWELYGNEKAVVLFVVREEAKARNISDQRMVEFAIRQMNKNINVMRRNFKEIHTRGQLQQNNRLFIDGVEVAVVYYRVGYSPECYPTEQEWSSRLMLERSKAVKCPSIAYQLAASKRVQAALAHPGQLDRFLSTECSPQIQSALTSQYKLEMDEEGNDLISLALQSPEKYVLKPQRDGGGNMFGEEMRSILENNPAICASYVLMERIIPPKFQNYIVAPGEETRLWNMDNELGIYGVVLGNGDDIAMNETCGHMLKSKPSDTNEGGVGKPLGALDSPFLI